jgi:hypothetical protein
MRKAIITLALTFAAFGCTTNRYPGSGQPASVMPSYGQPNQSATPGSSYGTEGIPPMASSYTGITRVDTDALATLAAEQGFRGRVLGPVNPAGIQVGVPTQLTGQLIPPAMIVNPQQTINTSVSSPYGNVGVASGGEVGSDQAVFLSAAGAAPATTGSAAVSATAASSSLAVTGAIGVGAAPPSGAIVPATTASSPSVSSGNALFAPTIVNGMVTGTTPTTATGRTMTTSALTVNNSIGVGAALPSGAVVPAATAVSPTVSGNVVFTPAVTSGTVTGTTRTTAVPLIALARTTPTTAAATKSAATSSGSVSAAIAPIRVMTSNKGQVVITNVNTAPTPTTPSTRPY